MNTEIDSIDCITNTGIDSTTSAVIEISDIEQKIIEQKIKQIKQSITILENDTFEDNQEEIEQLQKQLKTLVKENTPNIVMTKKPRKELIEDTIDKNPHLLKQRWHKIPVAIQEHLIRNFFVSLVGEVQNKLQVMNAVMEKFKKDELDINYDSELCIINKIYGVTKVKGKWVFEQKNKTSKEELEDLI